MLLLKELPTAKSLEKFAARYPGTDVPAITDFVNLLRACADISQALDRLLAKHGLLQGRWWLLVLLLRQDDLSSSPTELAEKAGVTKASITGFIDGLEREGLVIRMPDPADRRKYLIRLTAAGLQKLDETIPDYNSKVSTLMSALGQPERDLLLLSLRTLVAHLDVMR
ncbi:MAG: MarR family transcriptional regulator [Betaproteobacteria bacterium]|nr:MarR family transcriptional regulator [Betaproteobacteria bacterium]MDE2622456.1 MarR family transcriptional regulator [Betaproteobacteria bacterium]